MTPFPLRPRPPRKRSTLQQMGVSCVVKAIAIIGVLAVLALVVYMGGVA